MEKEKLTRRDFLMAAGLLTGGGAITAVVWGVNQRTKFISRLLTPEPLDQKGLDGFLPTSLVELRETGYTDEQIIFGLIPQKLEGNIYPVSSELARGLPKNSHFKVNVYDPYHDNQLPSDEQLSMASVMLENGFGDQYFFFPELTYLDPRTHEIETEISYAVFNLNKKITVRDLLPLSLSGSKTVETATSDKPSRLFQNQTLADTFGLYPEKVVTSGLKVFFVEPENETKEQYVAVSHFVNRTFAHWAVDGINGKKRIIPSGTDDLAVDLIERFAGKAELTYEELVALYRENDVEGLVDAFIGPEASKVYGRPMTAAEKGVVFMNLNSYIFAYPLVIENTPASDVKNRSEKEAGFEFFMEQVMMSLPILKQSQARHQILPSVVPRQGVYLPSDQITALTDFLRLNVS